MIFQELVGKQVKIKGEFPQKTGVIVMIYPAGLYHPEELYQITIFGNLGHTTSLTRSEFELLN